MARTGSRLPVLSQGSFRRLSDFIYDMCGIKLTPVKRLMLEGRLRKRLRALDMHSFDDYCDFLFSREGMQAEYIHMVDLVTTNKTDFFREPVHFEYLARSVLPEMVGVYGLGVKKPLKVWSAGCSTGEEPYSLVMALSEFGEAYPGFQFSVLATDISTRVLEHAMRGIYGHDRVQPVPLPLRKKYLLRSKDRSRDLVRILPGLRSLVEFRRLNFMEEDYGIAEPLGIIFCRNVLIYFDRPTQERVLNRCCEVLMPGGYLFTGHSETLHAMNLPLVQVATTLYRKCP